MKFFCIYSLKKFSLLGGVINLKWNISLLRAFGADGLSGAHELRGSQDPVLLCDIVV